LPVGRIAGVFGLRGELKCDPTPAGRVVFSEGARLRCVAGAAASDVTIAAVRPHKDRLLIRFDGVDDATAAGRYAGATLFASRERLEVDEGEFLDADLAGCAVVGIDGTNYGCVDGVEHYPASDMLIVAGRMIPMVSAIVRGVDLPARRITIDPPKGLLDEE